LERVFFGLESPLSFEQRRDARVMLLANGGELLRGMLSEKHGEPRRGTVKSAELQRRIKGVYAFRAVGLTRSDYASVGL